MLHNGKPSAIFALKNAVQASTNAGFGQAASANVATLGIFVQDFASCEAAVSASQSDAVAIRTQASASGSPLALVRLS